jgi:hypothetical protein
MVRSGSGTAPEVMIRSRRADRSTPARTNDDEKEWLGVFLRGRKRMESGKMVLNCPACHQAHSLDDVAAAARIGALMYVDRLCPWCRFVYGIGKSLNSPLGAALCGLVVATVITKIKERLS